MRQIVPMSRAEWQSKMGVNKTSDKNIGVKEAQLRQLREARQQRQQERQQQRPEVNPASDHEVEKSSPQSPAVEGSPRPTPTSSPRCGRPLRQYRPVRDYRPKGGRPFDDGSYRATEPWKAEGVSRATWFRRMKAVEGDKNDAHHRDPGSLPALLQAGDASH